MPRLKRMKRRFSPEPGTFQHAKGLPPTDLTDSVLDSLIHAGETPGWLMQEFAVALDRWADYIRDEYYRGDPSAKEDKFIEAIVDYAMKLFGAGEEVDDDFEKRARRVGFAGWGRER